jgi:glycosyltransferase involved in cell wall biosynthesis
MTHPLSKKGWKSVSITNNKIEVLVVTMFCHDYEALWHKMNIHGDAVISSQGDWAGREQKNVDGHAIDCIAGEGRGVSLNRNAAVSAASGDILIIADDDVVYDPGYQETVLAAYAEFPAADIILFHVPSSNLARPTFGLKKSKYCRFDEIVRFATFQVTFRRRVTDNGLRFDERFGPGSAAYGGTCGEDMLFLAQAYQRGHRIAYVKERIGVVNHRDSTWHAKEWSEEFFSGHGALFAATSKPLALPFILLYALLKHRAYREKVFLFDAVKHMLSGARSLT